MRGWAKRRGMVEGETSKSGGKEVLIKFVLLSIPNYAMSIFLLRKSFCNEMTTMITYFLRGRGGRSGGFVGSTRMLYVKVSATMV